LSKLSLALLCAAALCAQTAPPRPAASAKQTVDFDVNNIDRSANPCTDFYQYACGNWIKNNPIPPDQSRWGRFTELQERNETVLRAILEEAAKPDPKRNAVTQKTGDFYAACMDEKTIDSKGLTPLQPVFTRIRNIKDKTAIAGELARMHRDGINVAFSFSSGQDFKDSTSVIAQFDQGGLGLPDRDYYLKDDPKSIELRYKYVAHMAKMFELAGAKPAEAKANADTVMKLETALAKGSLDNVSRRDPEKVYHKMNLKEVEALLPGFGWTQYLKESGTPDFQTASVTWPDFFKALNTEFENTTLSEWKTYLIWHELHAAAPLLPAAFTQENFNFFGRTLTGATEMRPRWKRCVQYTDGDLGEALGQKFVDRTFGAEGKERTLKMVAALEKSLGEDIQALSWMTPATKQQAMIKLKAITNKIGYPDRWRDYSSVTIKPDDALGNDNRATEFEFQRQLDKIGKPVDRQEWFMTPPTVNAYYDPQMNNINFPAGILQPPFFDNKMDDAVNFGGIGMVIGHELTHGFDDQGRQFDPQGNLRDWWTPEDAKEFQQRAACVADEYSSLAVAPGVYVNGKLTLGENTADNGGVRVALMALLNTIGSRQQAKVDGFTPEQRFFLSFGQVWCENAREEALRLQVQTNPHSPAKFRVNGVVENMPEFQKAFSCKAGDKMVKANACHVW